MWQYDIETDSRKVDDVKEICVRRESREGRFKVEEIYTRV